MLRWMYIENYLQEVVAILVLSTVHETKQKDYSSVAGCSAGSGVSSGPCRFDQDAELTVLTENKIK